MKSKLSVSAPLRALAAAALLASLAACGGGTPASTASTVAPSYGGGLTPGSVTMTVTHQVTLTTNYGTIVVGLDGTHAPISTANFLAYVTTGFYNGTLFHRVVPGFVIQGGGFIDTSGTYSQKTAGTAIALESRNGLSNTQYTIAMARADDPNSATSQFYFNLVNNAGTLDFSQQNYDSGAGSGYAVFGAVSATDTTSIATINAIAAVPTGTNATFSAPNWPTADVVITSAVQNF
ncbi:MAG: peptidylprolyl isomerase [Pelomonas sp.]|nr:peptidylprolyl isomerase [Roseateles sp.]